MNHITVLKDEAVKMLSLKKDSVVIDATYGAGGHGRAICSQLGEDGIYVGIDADKTAFVDSFLNDLQGGPKHHLVNDNFVNIKEIVSSLHINRVDGILADLGWRSDQFTDGGKGFSFSSEDPLYMTYGEAGDYLFVADDIVNSWAEEDIANVIYGYGEERYSRRIAKAIVTARKADKIKTAKALAEVISSAVPASYRNGKTNPATKTFQALRIAVNDELKVVENFIAEAVQVLSPNGILAIITFHSLEDRVVKLAFRELAKTDDYTLLTKKPIVPSREEILSNGRARSAKLRVIQKNLF
ncbi:MAG: 16S rRNA (cytosine(1402)-N(4))-methyltransferase RsmH [Candidatus Paceibacterota bacterium]